MKLLLDSCVWGGALEELSTAGHDVLWIGQTPQDPGDEEILRQAFQDKRILITLDKDFGELAIVRGMAHCGILRLVNISARQQAKICLHILEHYGHELQAGALVTAEADRIRIRLPQDWRSSV